MAADNAPLPTPAPTAPPGTSGVLSDDGVSPPQTRPTHSWDHYMQHIRPQAGLIDEHNAEPDPGF